MDIALKGHFDTVVVSGCIATKLPKNAKKYLGTFGKTWVYTNHTFIFFRICDLSNNPPKTYKKEWNYGLEKDIISIV